MNELVRNSENPCPICGAKKGKIFIEISNVPVHCNVLWTSKESALNCPKGDIKLMVCPVCSYIMNAAFDPNRLEYTPAYENSLHFSSYFQNYAESLAKRLVKRYGLYNKDIIEIGCGKGYFLKLLCHLGNNRGVGFDPAYIEQNNNRLKGQITFIKDFYSERYANYQGDLIVCRQTLEHIKNPKRFLKMLKHNIRDHKKTQVFFEVPNSLKIFQELFIWDIIYEHCSYFTPTSLSLTFSSAGFHVCEITKEFGGQYLCVYAVPNKHINTHYHDEPATEADLTIQEIATFAEKFKNKVKKWRKKLDILVGNGQKGVVWGAGSKGVTFLNIFKDYKQIEYAVDINPLKQGMYIPGTGQKIVSPDFLREYHPNIVIMMNPLYKGEIKNFINHLGKPCKLVSA